MPLSPGSRIGVYEITGELGAGAMGRVFRARDTKLNRDVALKVLPEDVAGDTDRLARFEREAQVLASLNHPNIAAIYGIEESGPSTRPVLSDLRASTGLARTESKGSRQTVTALVMELVDGETLEERLRAPDSARTAGGPSQSQPSAPRPQPDVERTRALPLDDALAIAWQLADALEAAHEKGVIHRDLKPANIKLTRDGQVKVRDFGLAKAVGDDSAADAFTSPTVTSAATRAGVILGTPAYMSPEQARGRPVDKRADVWAFGVVLFEMLTGTQPFAGETATDSLAAVVHKDPDLDRLPADTSPGVRAALRRCLQKDVKTSAF